MIDYSTIDFNPYNGTSYYRLMQTDFDGKYTHSNLVEINFKKSVDFNIYPNPFSKNVTITINDAVEISNYELKIYNALGKEVIETIVNKQITIIETSSLPSGMYFYKFVQSRIEGEIKNDKIIQSGILVSQQ